MNAEDIKKLRERLGLNQEKLGQLLDVHAMTVSKWERGVLEPTPYQSAMMDEFLSAATKKDIKSELKRVLIAAGVVAAIFLLLKIAKEK